MKKIIYSLFVSLIIGVMLSGCGDSALEKEDVTDKTSVIEGADFLEITPDTEKIFPDKKIIILDNIAGDAYIFIVTDVDRGMCDTYTAACDKTFINKTYDIDRGETSGNVYEAKTSDGRYIVNISYMADNHNMTVSVKRKREQSWKIDLEFG